MTTEARTEIDFEILPTIFIIVILELLTKLTESLPIAIDCLLFKATGERSRNYRFPLPDTEIIPTKNGS